ncbi:MAG TPA: hypothetical protein VE990_09545 [Acidimicrobiales bacterium]|nr:hypothetical protein [Acidimicrobiales bacterium]
MSNVPLADLYAPVPARRRGRIAALGGSIAAVGAAAVAGLFVVGSPATPAVAQVLSRGASNTLSAGSMRISMTVNERVQRAAGPDVQVSITSQGVTDRLHKQADLTEQIGGYGALEIRQVGNLLYLHLPANLPTRVPTPWASVEVPATPASGSSSLYDPVGQLQSLTGSGFASSVTNLGTEAVDGVQTTHYHAVLNPSAVLGAASANPLLGPVNLSQVDITTLTADMWIDAGGLARRFVSRIALYPTGQTAAGVTATITLHLYDFGVAVSVQPPPASQVTPVGNLTQVLGTA